jgi:uncharacterized membrane protein
MKTHIQQMAERARSRLWVLPALCTIVAALLAAGLIALDERLGGDAPKLPWAFQGGADSAQTVLSTIAGSMITVAGTVYSLTIVVLTLASAQFAPRVLRSFLRDRANQMVLGFFVATFTYCLLVLRAVRASDQGEFVPRTAVTGGVILALISVAMLIYFIDHIFHSIQVSNILAVVARETQEQIVYLYPRPWQEGARAAAASPTLPDDSAKVPADRSGYLQFVDYDTLLALAVREGLVLREEHHVGDFVTAGTSLLSASPAAQITPALAVKLNASFVLGSNPTLQQDIAYGLRQIVDIALKAISPAVNDPTTAVNCIDHLSAILITLATRQIPDRDYYDSGGQVRIIVRERTFHDLVRLAFDQIRHYGAGDHIIVIRMLSALGRVAAVTHNPAYRDTLRETAEHIAHSANRAIADDYERRAVEEHLEEVRQLLRAPESAPAPAAALRG